MSPLEIATAIALEAGALLVRYQSGDLHTRTKAHEYDFVTSADLDSEKLIIARLQAHFPHDSILIEESGYIPSANTNRVWMVDPLDSTKAYKNGGKGFAVMIGLCEKGKPVMGVVYAPALDLLYFAAKGNGAYLRTGGKESRLHVSGISSLNDARMVTRIFDAEARASDAIIEIFQVKERIPAGSAGIKVGLISSGDAEFHINTNQRASKWDTCASQVILEESGGVITDLNGAALDYNQKDALWRDSYAASNGALHPRIIQTIAKYKREQ